MNARDRSLPRRRRSHAADWQKGGGGGGGSFTGAGSCCWDHRQDTGGAKQASTLRRRKRRRRREAPPPRPPFLPALSDPARLNHEGAAWLRYALLCGLPVPQGAHRAAAHEGGLPAAAAGWLQQPLQEGHARPLWLRQRHRVLQRRRRVAGVRWVDSLPAAAVSHGQGFGVSMLTLA